MPRTPQDITEAELAILQVLWEQPGAPIRQIAKVLYAKPSTTQYSTVQKQLERMEGKGFVRRDRSLFVHQFSSSVDRDELIGRRLRAVADKLCGGSLAPILSHLARAKKLTDAERKALRDLIDEPTPRFKGDKRPKE
jgi:BlaI family penicillinase repressor